MSVYCAFGLKYVETYLHAHVAVGFLDSSVTALCFSIHLKLLMGMLFHTETPSDLITVLLHLFSLYGSFYVET